MKRLLSALIVASACSLALADEGMWLLNALPTDQIKAATGVTITPPWVQRLQRASVRFETGGSGSIVSPDGLVMTNHHVGSDMLVKLGTPDRNLMRDGFIARTRDQELKCPDLELRVLWDMEDVTHLVTDATQGLTPPAAAARRRENIASIESASLERTGLHSEVVTLFQGGRYHLYRYKRFTDVRLVFAPEDAIAFFGGDTDNFEFPRYNLDCCFFRIYENNQPLKPPFHLAWNPAGTRENDPVFVTGHPGRTRRLYTADHLRFLRDIELPARLAWLNRAEVRWRVFSGRSARHARLAQETLLLIENSRKAYTGLLAGLQDPALMDRKIRDESALRDAVAANPEWDARWSDAWEEISSTQLGYENMFSDRFILERAKADGLLARAFSIVLLASELPKPDAKRLDGFHDSQLDSLYLNLYSPEPVEPLLEVERLTQALSALAEHYSGEWIPIVRALAGQGPADRARDAVARTTLADPAARKALVDGGIQAVEASTDPIIEIARALESEWRDVQEDFETHVRARERAAYARIADAVFAVRADSTYPDATFTLRLSYGRVAGIPDLLTPPFTDFAGLFARADERAGEPAFSLPKRWQDARDAIDPAVPFNFICTTDIIGGNSGSPVVDADGRIVGLIFDGNAHSLVGDVFYDARLARAVAVDVRAMIHALDKVYAANELLAELGVAAPAQPR